MHIFSQSSKTDIQIKETIYDEINDTLSQKILNDERTAMFLNAKHSLNRSTFFETKANKLSKNL